MVKDFGSYQGHVPVLVQEVLNLAHPVLKQPGSSFLDGTFGGGGHFQAIWKAFQDFIDRTFAVDLDKQAIERALALKGLWGAPSEIFHGSFDQIPSHWGFFDFILLDLGMSSYQIHQPERGFSFYLEGPLDMRMNQDSDLTAAYVVNHYSANDLMRIFKDFGEIRNPKPVVDAILRYRQKKTIETTKELSWLIEKTEGWKIKGFHPATLYFQALRIEVNQELKRLQSALKMLPERLKTNGRICIITFHSLEDRIVKNIFKESPWFKPVTKKVIKPTRDEIRFNPRSRSAKLRCYYRFFGP